MDAAADDETAEAADVLIIGAGASGAAAAWRLSQGGFRVVCLEQGAWMNPSRYPTRERNWEVRARQEWSGDPNVRRRRDDYPIDSSGSPISPLMFNGVGGSTTHWTADAPRLHPSDFRVRTLDEAADDWPLTYEDLEPFYDQNDGMMGCAGADGDPAYPSRSPRAMPPLPLGDDGTHLARAFDDLGWHWWPADSYINSVPHGGRDACNYCGPVGLGCTRRARSSTDLTYWPEAIRLGAVLRTRCRVSGITVDRHGRATGASYFDAGGQARHQPARSVVLAANGLGTPRLLLASGSQAHPGGLLNSTELVGRNLMFHPSAVVTGFFPEFAETWRGPRTNILTSHEFYETDPRRDFVRGYSLRMTRGTGPFGTAFDDAHGPVAWGEGHHQEFAERFGHTAALVVTGEDLPEEHNRVTLDERLRDGSGIPAPTVTYTLSDNSRRMLDHAAHNARRALEAAGATRILVNPLLHAGGSHLMGTARMGADPERSVVNEWGQGRDADNVFIVDGSVFVTAGAVSPTPTIQALALRTADYIVRERGDLKGRARPAPEKVSTITGDHTVRCPHPTHS